MDKAITLYKNVHLATMVRQSESDPLGLIYDGAILHDGDSLLYAGPLSGLPQSPAATLVEDMQGAWATPGFIDCHTHLIFAGDRSKEHALRATGASYEEIARAGGGIKSTVADTRKATQEELLTLAKHALIDFMAHGVTTMEVKSGYGLSLEHELKQLRVAKALKAEGLVDVEATCLAAHAVPVEFAGNADGYVTLICDEIIPAVAKENLATAVDAFMENIGFTAEQTQKAFAAARAHGLRVKLHADQLSDLGGAGLAADHGALSADHLEYTNADSIARMQKNKTVAVLLPGAYVTLNETHTPPIAALRKAGVPMAVASDYNPGSNPSRDFLSNLNYAVTEFNMTQDEVLLGVTCHAAKALALPDRGVLKAGTKAHIAFWNIDHPHDLCAPLKQSPLLKRIYHN